jgi:hypothetical protein
MPLTVDLLLADNTAPTGTQGVLSTLLAWHKAHPPTDYERNRNNAIYSGVNVSGITAPRAIAIPSSTSRSSPMPSS